MKIRPATVQDVFRCAAIGKPVHETTSFASLHYDEDVVASYLISMIVDKTGDYFVTVAEDDQGVIVGGMAGYITKTWFGPDKIALDVTLFLTTEARGGMAAARLVKEFIAWAKLRGAKQIRPGVATGRIGTTAEGLYAKLGLTKVGSYFCLEV